MRWLVGLAVTLATTTAAAPPHRMDVSADVSADVSTAYSLAWLSDRSMSTHPSVWVQGPMFGIRVAYAPL